MKITDLLKAPCIEIGAEAADKNAAIDKLVSLMQNGGNVADVEGYTAAVRAREELGTTALGEGIAIPHAKTAAVSAPGLAAMTVPAGVDYDAPDGKPTTLLFLIAAPDTEANVHLQVLSRLSMLLMNPDFCEALRAAATPEDFLKVIDDAEAEKVAKEEAAEAAAAERDAQGYDVVAVTACPTGIAHTYMAAEGLEKQAAKMGIKIKVETQGSAGAKNVLSAEDIAGAKGVIVAADKNVELARFDGKPLFTCPVARGINEPEELINQILQNKAPIYHATAAAEETQVSATAEKESFGRKLYKQFMDGISNVLPVAIAGGLFCAAATLVGGAAGIDANPTAEVLNFVGGLAFTFMLPVLAAFIANAIADRPGFMPGLVGGSLALAGCGFNYFATANAELLQGSGVIGAIVAGFAAGYITLGVERLCEKFPPAFEGIKPTLIYPVLGVLGTTLVMLALNPALAVVKDAFCAFLTGLSLPALVVLCLVLGAMMSVDLGGPCNKAAYALGVCVLDPSLFLGTTGQVIMAAVMAGGMVPPLAIALNLLVFKNRWTADDIAKAPSNIIMGLCFMSEGAIPFAAADRAHVLPGFIAGSAVAGALSAAFGCASPAPHGGAWIFLLVGNGIQWLAAIALGALAGCLVIAALKKPQTTPEK